MAPDVDELVPVARGVNSARGWGRLGRACMVELAGVAVVAVWFYFALLAPSLADLVPQGVEGWAYVGGLLLIPMVGASALIVLGVRLRVAPVGLVLAVLLGVCGVLPWPGEMIPRWGVGLVLAPVVASLVTHPRPWGGRTSGPRPSGRVDGPVDLQAGAADLDRTGREDR